MFGQPAAAPDVDVPQPPTALISSVSIGSCQGVHCLFAGSWDNQVRAWEYRKDTRAVAAKASIAHSAPVLALHATTDGHCFSGSCDNTVKMWRLGGEPTQVAQHEQPVSAVRAIPEMGALLTASWDKSVKLWDVRSNPARPQGTVPLPDKCYAMDVQPPLAVFACADRGVVWYDLTMNAPQNHVSPLKFQTRSVCCFADKSGYAISSIEGRLAVQNFNGSMQLRTKCHKGPDNKQPGHPAHSLSAFPLPQRADVFASAGGDGVVAFYDKQHKSKVHTIVAGPPVVAGQFSADGALYAYATCYDFMRGPEGANPNVTPAIKIHSVTEQELAPKPKS